RNLGGPPAPEDFAAEALANTKPDHRKGLTPEFVTSNALRDEDQAAQWRRLGFTAHLVAPEGGYLAGQSALISLSGRSSRETIVRSPVALHGGFLSVPGSEYPRSRMGEVAHVRQMLLDAEHYQRWWQSYEQNGRQGRQPPWDPALQALAPVLERKLPWVIEADTADEILRGLALAEEFSIRPIIFGGREAFKVVDVLKAKNVPVILRINFRDPNPEAEKNWPQRAKYDQRFKEREQMEPALVLLREGVKFALSTSGQGGDKPWESFQNNLRKLLALKLPAEALLSALTTSAADILGVSHLGRVEKGRPAHLVLMDGEIHEAGAVVRSVFADGVRFEFEAKPRDPNAKLPEIAEVKPLQRQGPDRDTEFDVDRRPTRKLGGNGIIRGATILPVAGPPIPSGEVEFAQGKIVYVGPARPDVKHDHLIEAPGMFVMPGIIDTHSHFAIEGGVNEFSLSIVPEVRVRDVVDSDDVSTYRGAAGGVTTARLLHGSANCIAGQDAVIKLKYKARPADMLIADAPRGVKFALGENVKRTDGRFPNSRMGVEAVLVRAFSEAQAYRKLWYDYRQNPAGKLEPRRDLRLEALADILEGQLHIHCHCYRADEILMLLRVADQFGVKVKSLQHVLEGYKVAPEIAAHGAWCSLFSDWWAYKIEAYDAIPYAAALLHAAGAGVCLKSDSHELMRHMDQEAAKMIKYGGMDETEALKTITLNGAKQLGLERRIGSIEVGKDADLVIFNGHPLNSFSRVEMTIIDGEIYFERSSELKPFAPAQVSPAKPVPQLPPIAANPAGTYFLTDVTLHRGDGSTIESAGVLIHQGKIAAVVDQTKPHDLALPEGTRTISLKGLHLFPGMIDAGTVLGLIELGSARETQDYVEGGDFQPDLRASTAVNPDSELIPVTRANGVLTVVTRPMGGLLAGQSAVLNLAGWTAREMTVLDPFAMHLDLPADGGHGRFISHPNSPFAARALERRQREEKIRRLKELFQQAAAYDAARKVSPDLPVNPRFEALLPYVKGEKPLVISARKKIEIEEALKLADDLKLKVILAGAIDAWRVAPELKKREIPVILGPVMSLPTELYDPYDAPFACAAKLHAAGVRFCIRSGGASNTRNLPYEAAMAVAYGLPPEEGLKAVTIYPAQILGLADQLGSIDLGKRANLVITNGDILQASTQVLGLFVDGKPYPPTSKHTQLYERYQQRLREMGKAVPADGTR
ncbi:MAG: amidohydrolase family protein, partial [Gemmataceae bacterium]|nr:amidohydrolase family protein [Gemmataceae bacterium]